MLSTKFPFIWPSSFREDFLVINQSETRIAYGVMFANESSRNYKSLQRIFHRCLLTSFGSFGQAVLGEKIFQKSANQKQELPVAAMFVNGLGRNVQFSQRTFHRCFLPSFHSFGETVSEEKIFQKSTNQKKELHVCGGHVCERIGTK